MLLICVVSDDCRTFTFVEAFVFFFFFLLACVMLYRAGQCFVVINVQYKSLFIFIPSINRISIRNVYIQYTLTIAAMVIGCGVRQLG